MFCTLCLEESKKRFCRNLKTEEKQIGNIAFIKATIHKKSAIKKFEKKIKNKADTVILSENLKGYQFKNLKVYNNDFFIKNIAKYTFKNIVRLSKIPPNSLTVCIKDSKFEFSELVYSLAVSTNVIKIITKNFAEYNIISEKIYDDYGMELIISDSVENADLGIDFDCENPKIWFNTPENYVEITKKCVKLSAGLKGYVPKGISECDFAGMLQNYQEFKRLKLLHADVMLKNDKFFKINYDNIKNFLDNKSECW